MKPFTHIPVLQTEACQYLNLKIGSTYVDGTLGGAGHSSLILKSILPNGRLICIDQDIDAIENAEAIFSKFMQSHNSHSADTVKIVHSNYSDMPTILSSLGINGVDGILLDLGFSFHQLMESQRGFSFQKDEPLDMRMDTKNSTTAADVVNGYSESALADIFFRYGEERMSRKIARQIVQKRAISPIASTGELANLVKHLMPAKLLKSQKIHPATRVFQALRIEVNQELDHLEKLLSCLPDMLNSGGRFCVISFHSLEDRIVKHAIRKYENGCTCPKSLPECICGFVPKLKAIVKKPIIPSQDEIIRNPLSRSAKLRVAQKI
ncbi:MAG: 16S rRNA (cytosine(1402)-N(4))-methyltransferase RsmH [Desulfamplus sp.]|nr:16S rRNA (cytosine(1402)-N(4))-methyltransferase RsmH [Desulfamplus sp.]